MKKKLAENRPTQRVTSRTEKKTLVWIMAGFLISFWMFVLGLLVGRDTAPVQFDIHKLQNDLAALKKATIDKTTEQYRQAFNNIELGFPEALDGPPLNHQLQPQCDGNVAANTPSDVRHKKRQDIFKKKKPVVTKPVSGPDSQRVVQVIATKDEGYADEIVSKLKTLGYHAYRTSGTLPGKGTWHRVRVGGCKDETEARTVVQKLKEEHFSPMILEE